MPQSFSVLILDDNEPDCELLKNYLNRSVEEFEISLVHTKKTFLDALRGSAYDLIISDYQLIEFNAFEVIRLKNEISKDTPIVIVSGFVGDETAVELIRKGASDFLSKKNAEKRLAQVAIRAIQETEEKALRKKAEKELGENLRRYRTLFETSLDGILIATPDENGQVIDANNTLCEMLGYSLDEMRHLRRKDFFREENNGLNKLLSDREKGHHGVFKGELHLQRKDGSEIPVEVTSRIIEFEDGDERTYSVIRDIQERKKVESQIQWDLKKRELLKDIAQIINQNKRFEAAMEACLVRINKFLGWSLGHVFFREPKTGAFKSLDLWNQRDYKAEQFIECSSQIRFETKNGIVGRVASTHSPMWFNPENYKSDFIRHEQVEQLDLKTALIYPVVINGTTEAVLEFYNNTYVEPDQNIKSTLESVTDQIARLIERKHYFDNINKEKDKYRLLAHNSTDMICRHKPEGDFLYVSPAVKRLLGYKPDELVGESPYELIHEDDQKKVAEVHHSILDDRVINPITYRMRKKNGDWLWVESVSKAIQNPKSGNIEEIQSATRNIQERKQYELKLKRQVKLNENILNSLPGIFFMVSGENEIVRVNDKFREALDYKTVDEISDMKIQDFVVQTDKSFALRSIKKAFQEGSIEVEVELETASGDVIPFLINGVKNELDDQEYLLATGIDISDRIKIEKALEKEKEFSEKALNSLPGLFFMLDEENNFVRVNQNLIDEMGYSYEEIENMKPLDFYEVSRYEEVLNAIETAFTIGEASLVTQMVKKNGDKPHYFLTGTRFQNEGKNYILGTGIDISEKKELESLLAEAHKLARIGGWEVDLEEKSITWSTMTRDIHEVKPDYTPDFESALNFYKQGNSRKKITEIFTEAITDNIPFDEELKIITAKGNERWVRTIGNPEFKNGECVRLYGSFQDIHKMKVIEEELKESLKEKEILLMEIHHRVKNNLALVSGILQLQAFQSDNKELHDHLSNSQSRIKTISTIHELLYQTENFSRINLKDDINKLIEHISETFGDHTDVNFNLDLEDVLVNVNQAIPCALIVNEVLTNTYKHAFKDRKKGNVEIKLDQADRKISILISDDGVGLPEDFDSKDHKSLGLKLINTLNIQLNGDISFETVEDKTIFTLIFNQEEDSKGSANHFLK